MSKLNVYVALMPSFTDHITILVVDPQQNKGYEIERWESPQPTATVLPPNFLKNYRKSAKDLIQFDIDANLDDIIQKMTYTRQHVEEEITTSTPLTKHMI